MKNEEIVRALRCISTAGGENACEHCPYWKEEEVPEEERPIYGADTWHSCDVDRVGLDGADLIERLSDRCARYAEEIAVLQERTRWIPVTERLPEEGVPVLINYIGTDGEVYADGVAVWTECGCFWWEGSLADCEEDVAVPITHWRPLPEGPEVEG